MRDLAGFPPTEVLPSVSRIETVPKYEHFMGAAADTPEHREAIRRFLAQCSRAHLFQTPEWCEMALGTQVELAVSYREGSVCAVSYKSAKPIARLLTGWHAVRGPVASDPEALREHMKALRATASPRLLWIRVSPLAFDADAAESERALAEAGCKLLEPPNHYVSTLVIDLQRSLDEIRSDLREKFRSFVRKMDTYGLDIRETRDSNETAYVVAMLNKQASERNLEPVPPGLAGLLASSRADVTCDLRTIVTVAGGKVVAAIVVGGLGDRATYIWGFSSQEPEHRKLPLTHLAHWKAICNLKADGYRWYDLGGFWADAGDSDPINLFKLGFSKTPQKLPREYYLPCLPILPGVLAGIRQRRAESRMKHERDAKQASADAK